MERSPRWFFLRGCIEQVLYPQTEEVFCISLPLDSRGPHWIHVFLQGGCCSSVRTNPNPLTGMQLVAFADGDSPPPACRIVHLGNPAPRGASELLSTHPERGGRPTSFPNLSTAARTRWISGSSKGRRGVAAVHRRIQSPEPVRPARPARWAAEAADTGCSSSRLAPSRGRKRGCRWSPASTTTYRAGSGVARRRAARNSGWVEGSTERSTEGSTDANIF